MDNHQIKARIGEMTPEEKAGQLIQLPTRLFGNGDSELTGTHHRLHMAAEEKWLVASLLGRLDTDSIWML